MKMTYAKSQNYTAWLEVMEREDTPENKAEWLEYAREMAYDRRFN